MKYFTSYESTELVAVPDLFIGREDVQIEQGAEQIDLPMGPRSTPEPSKSGARCWIENSKTCSLLTSYPTWMSPLPGRATDCPSPSLTASDGFPGATHVHRAMGYSLPW